MEKNINRTESKENTNIAVVRNLAEAAYCIYRLQDIFDEEDPHGVYMQRQDEMFEEMMSAVQHMLGCQAFWEIGMHPERYGIAHG